MTKLIASIAALGIGLLTFGDAFGQVEPAQPLTRSDCEKAHMAWKDDANVCGSQSGVTESGSDAASSDNRSQPLTRADCDKVGAVWNDNANVCDSSSQADAGAAPNSTPSGQPLTRAACDEAKMEWNEIANVCGVVTLNAAAPSASSWEASVVETTGQPLTRAGCSEAGMTWSERANVCDSRLAEGAKAQKSVASRKNAIKKGQASSRTNAPGKTRYDDARKASSLPAQSGKGPLYKFFHKQNP